MTSPGDPTISSISYSITTNLLLLGCFLLLQQAITVMSYILFPVTMTMMPFVHRMLIRMLVLVLLVVLVLWSSFHQHIFYSSLGGGTGIMMTKVAIHLVDVMNYIYTTKSSFDSRIQPFPSTQSLLTLFSSSSSLVTSIAGIDAVSDFA